MNQTIAPFARSLYVMTKPVGAVCNLACDYCYYLEKANLYKDISKHVMSDEPVRRNLSANTSAHRPCRRCSLPGTAERL